MKNINLLLVDDHKIVRDGIRSLLKDEKNLVIYGEADNGKLALTYLEQHHSKIDLVLMDINMPEMDGIECTEKILATYPKVKVLALTMLNEEQHIRQMLKAGAAGYLLKNSGQDELITAIDTVVHGSPYFSREATEVVMRDMLKLKSESDGSFKSSTLKTEKVHLTQREKDILRLIVKEYTNQEISEELFISVRTVDAHRRNLLQKIGARNAAGLAVYAMKQGLLDE